MSITLQEILDLQKWFENLINTQTISTDNSKINSSTKNVITEYHAIMKNIAAYVRETDKNFNNEKNIDHNKLNIIIALLQGEIDKSGRILEVVNTLKIQETSEFICVPNDLIPDIIDLDVNIDEILDSVTSNGHWIFDREFLDTDLLV